MCILDDYNNDRLILYFNYSIFFAFIKNSSK